MERSLDGFTLIEVLISIVIGLFVIGGAFSTFIGQQAAYTTQNEVLEVQQNLRFVNQFLAREIRNSGYGMAGSSLGGSGSIDLATARPFLVQNNNIAQTISLASGGNVSIDDNTDSFDILTAQYITTLKNDANPASANFRVNDANQITPGDLLLVSNGADASFFQATNVNTNNGTVVHNPGLSNFNLPGGQQKQGVPPYVIGSRVYKIFWYKYFISGEALQRVSYNSLTFNGNNMLPNGPEVIALNIEDMQLAFGLDTDGDPTTLAIDTWDDNGLTAVQLDDIRAVRVGVTARSTRQVRTVDGRGATTLEDHDPTNDAGYDANDYVRFIRRVTSSTIRVRNYGI